MAAIAEMAPGTVVGDASNHDDFTQNRTRLGSEANGAQPEPTRFDGRGRTEPGVEPLERGDDSLRNSATVEGQQLRRATRPQVAGDVESARLRSEVARDIRARVRDLRSVLGDLSLTTNVQLLGRELSRAHDALRNTPSEANFLSIVTLIESSLAQTRWKEFTKEQIDLLGQAADLGYRKTTITFDDYDRLRQAFSKGRIETHPRIDLDRFELGDLTDDDEEE